MIPKNLYILSHFNLGMANSPGAASATVKATGTSMGEFMRLIYWHHNVFRAGFSLNKTAISATVSVVEEQMAEIMNNTSVR